MVAAMPRRNARVAEAVTEIAHGVYNTTAAINGTYDNLDETERQELARTGEQTLDTLLDGPGLSPTT